MSGESDGDSKLSITGSVVGIVALALSVSTIVQAFVYFFVAYRDAPAELRKYTSSISNTMDERMHRLRQGHVPGPVGLRLGNNNSDKGLYAALLEEFFTAHLALEEELVKIKAHDESNFSLNNWNRITWIFRRKDLDESVRRVETLRMRKMAVTLNAMMVDVTAIKDTLDRIESRIPAGRVNLPPPKPPNDEESALPRPVNLYASSVMGESVVDIVRTSLDSG